jgi:hypothetical protein
MAEYHRAPVSLCIYLGDCFMAAAYDLPDVPAGVLYARFLGWGRARLRT